MYMDIHLMRLIEAIKLVKANYECYVTKTSNEEKIVKRAERVYAYELYHQYRSLMERDGIDDCYLNGEIYKNSKIFDAIDGHNCSPDLVLHKEFDKIDEESQYFLCEIKMVDNQALIEDIDKLTKLSQSNLNFNYYIFLCVGATREALKSKLNNKKRKINYNDNIVCICVNNCTPDVFKLGELSR